MCENVIGSENLVSMSGNDFTKTVNFWEAIGKKIELSMNAEISEESADFSEIEQK